MKTFKYINNKVGKVLAEIQADDILVADELLKEQTGVIALKSPWVGCQVSEVPDECNMGFVIWKHNVLNKLCQTPQEPKPADYDYGEHE